MTSLQLVLLFTVLFSATRCPSSLRKDNAASQPCSVVVVEAEIEVQLSPSPTRWSIPQGASKGHSNILMMSLQYMAHLTANATLTGNQLRGKCVAIIFNIILHVQKDDCALRMDDVVRQTNTAMCKLLQWSSFQGIAICWELALSCT